MVVAWLQFSDSKEVVHCVLMSAEGFVGEAAAKVRLPQDLGVGEEKSAFNHH